MKKYYFFLIAFTALFTAQAQFSVPTATHSNQPINWGHQTKAAGDSCGVYFNNYVGLAKTSLIRIERMRTGNLTESGEYNGRAQKFTAPQPIEVSGIEFYAYIADNPSVDSLLVVTTLNEYDAAGNTLGTELARDSVYVFHDSYNPLSDPIPTISVTSNFESPVTVTSDYMVAIFTPTDDSLRIIANEFSVNDGAGEGNGYALYDNINFPTFFGWYDMIIDFSADYDFLISPKIKYVQPNDFILSDTVVCPNTSPVCLTYMQVPIQASNQYNRYFANAQNSIGVTWGDGNSDNDNTTACNSYTVAGAYTVNLKDTIRIWDAASPNCLIDISKPITVTDTIGADFTFTQNGLTVNFSSITVNADSVSWDFGDNSAFSSDFNPIHTYSAPGNYNVWFYAFNGCTNISLFKTITILPSSVAESTLQKLLVYPNPANDFVNISGLPQNTSVIIYNIAGKAVYSKASTKDQTTINLSNFANGTYFVRLATEAEIVTKKISIKH